MKVPPSTGTSSVIVVREFDDKKYNHTVPFGVTDEDRGLQLEALLPVVAARFKLSTDFIAFSSTTMQDCLSHAMTIGSLLDSGRGTNADPLRIVHLPSSKTTPVMTHNDRPMRGVSGETAQRAEMIAAISKLAIFDPWAAFQTGRDDNKAFKRALATYYEANEDESKAVKSSSNRAYSQRLRCLLTDCFLQSRVVCAAHLMPAKAPVTLLEDFGMQKQLDSPRNGLLLYKPLEMAYDRNQITFISEAGTIRCIVADHSIMNMSFQTYMADQLTKDSTSETQKAKFLDPYKCADELIERKLGSKAFSAVHGKPLAISKRPEDGPFRRVLYYHATLTARRAKINGWLDIQVPLDLSDEDYIYKKHFGAWACVTDEERPVTARPASGSSLTLDSSPWFPPAARTKILPRRSKFTRASSE